jgi:hypothetical protein
MTDTTEIPPPPEEPPVEIHKPHAAKTWKEFFIELGTITAGILIALALEQLVEYVHWQHEVEIGRQSIRAEIAANNDNLFAVRDAVASCVARQIKEADAVLTALEEGRKSAMTSFRPPPTGPIRDSEWQSERASQVLTHFPRDELAIMSRYYAQLPAFNDWETAEAIAWQELGVLRKPPAGITPSDLIRLRVSLGNVRTLERLTASNARRELRLSKQLGIADSVPDPVRIKNYCTMNEEEYQRYRGDRDMR